MSVALMSCQKTEQGVLQPVPPLAGLRYVNLVSDTSAVDFRIINFIGDAPSAGAATFRTGGASYGVSSTFLPPHWPVEADREVHIRVFMNGTTPAIASQEVFDTTCTFAAGVNYTFLLYGTKRVGGAGVHALVTTDTLPAPTGIAFRVINLAPSLAGAAPTLADTTVLPDVWVKAPDAVTVSAFSGTPVRQAVAYKSVSAYTAMATGASYWAGISATGSTSPIGLFALPAGSAGTVTTNPNPGTNVAGTAFTLVIVPRAVTSAALGGPSTKTVLAMTRSNDTVTVQTGYLRTWIRRWVNVGGVLTLRPDSVISPSSANVVHGASTSNFFMSVSGANEAQYNGWQRVTSLADTVTCMPVDSVGDLRRSCTTLNPAAAPPINVILTTMYRFRYRITGTPTSPATGTPVVRGPHTTTDGTIPALIALIDRKPALTAP